LDRWLVRSARGPLPVAWAWMVKPAHIHDMRKGLRHTQGVSWCLCRQVSAADGQWT
jgi:hypothetical protein